MAKYVKDGSNIVLKKIKPRELSALLKCNVVCDIVFLDEGGLEEARIGLGDRGFDGTKNTIEVTLNTIGYQSYGYADLLALINQYSGRVLDVVFDMKTFQDKEPLLLMLNEIKPDMVSICTYIDYYDEKFLLMNNPFKNGTPNKIYYWTETNSILAFTQKGPVIINEKFGAIEEFLCN